MPTCHHTLGNRDSALHSATPGNNKRELDSVGLMRWILTWEVLRMHHLLWVPMGGHAQWVYGDPEEMRTKKQAAAETSVPWSHWGEWTVPAPEFTGPQPAMTDLSEVCRHSLCLAKRPLLRTQLSPEDWSAAPQTGH